jgi:programmed cell death protein 5
VKPEKGRAIEDLLIKMAQGGQINGKVDEKTLIGFLNQINDNQQVESKIKVISFASFLNYVINIQISDTAKQKVR